MQAVTNEQYQENNTSKSVVISGEMLAYIVLIAFTVILRFTSLGEPIMTDAEATQALSAYQVVYTDTQVTPQPAQSGINFWIQTASFTVFGGTEFSARLAGALGGIALVLVPLLFRNRFGREQTFILSLILAFSPIAFTSARFADSSIWTMVFAGVALWSIWQYWDAPTRSHAITLALSLSAMTFLTGAGGILLLLVLILAFIMTITWAVLTAPTDRDTIGDDVLEDVNTFINSLPLMTMSLFAIGLIVISSTAFMLYPNGLNIVTEALGQAFAGFIQLADPNAPNIFALLALVIYEPILVLLAIISAALIIANNQDTVIDRFVIAWAGVGFLFLLIYRGSQPAYALWIVAPLAVLVSRLIAESLFDYLPNFLSVESYLSDNPKDYAWIRWLVASVMFGGLIMMSLYLEIVGRSMLTYPGGQLRLSTDTETLVLYGRFGWFFIMAILLVVLYFLFSSIWGNRVVLQGYALGTFGFMLMIGLGTGWNTAVININSANELWYTTGISPDAYELRETLLEVARRESRGFPSLNLTILRDEEAGISDAGLIGWLVRDFNNVEFVDSIGEAYQDEIILLPLLEAEPDLGGSYVGQSFVLREYWVRGQSLGLDWLSWFTQRDTLPYILPEQTTVLWLRIDVYDGVPAFQRP